MHAEFYCFGEILWDCLPSGRHVGGAPFNVAAHLAQLGRSVRLLSSVGSDAMGDELLEVARDKGVDTSLTTRSRSGLATGTVNARVDPTGNATYEIVQPVAWDEIPVDAGTLQEIKNAKAIVFGSLAARSPSNQGELQKLLALEGPLRFFDVNLRVPFVDPQQVLDLAGQSDVLKLNDDEVGRLSHWVRNKSMECPVPQTAQAVAEACTILAEAIGTSRICVTRGSQGALLWEGGTFVTASAPEISVRDTVGAGDAFMAGLVAGLTSSLPPAEVLGAACRMGAFVASHHGATPLLPEELKQLFARAG